MAKSSTRKKLDALIESVFDEMEEHQLKATLAFIKETTTVKPKGLVEDDDEEEAEVEDEDEKPAKKKRAAVEEDDEEDDDVKPSKKNKKAAVEEDDEEDDEPVIKKRNKKKEVEEDDEDEDASEEDEDDDSSEEDEDEEDDDVKPAKKTKKKAAAEDEEDDSESDAEDDGDAVDYSSMSVVKLKKAAADNGINVKVLLKKSTDEKKSLVKALKKFDAAVEELQTKKLTVLEKVIAKYDVDHKGPRGRSDEAKKKLFMARSIAKAGYPFED